MKPPTSERIRNLTAEVIVDIIGCEESSLRPEARFKEDLGADSLDMTEIVMGVEEEFFIDIPDDEAGTLATVADLTSMIERKPAA